MTRLDHILLWVALVVGTLFALAIADEPYDNAPRQVSATLYER